MYTSAACSSPIGQSRCGNRHTSSDGSVDSVANHGRTLACQLSTRLQYDSPDRVKVEYFQSRFERFVLSGPGCGSSLQCCVAYALLSMDPKPLTSNLAVHPVASRCKSTGCERRLALTLPIELMRSICVLSSCPPDPKELPGVCLSQGGHFNSCIVAIHVCANESTFGTSTCIEVLHSKP